MKLTTEMKYKQLNDAIDDDAPRTNTSMSGAMPAASEFQPVEIMVDKKGMYGLRATGDRVAGRRGKRGQSIILRPDRIHELADADELIASPRNAVLQLIPIRGLLSGSREGQLRDLVCGNIRRRGRLGEFPWEGPDEQQSLKVWYGAPTTATKIINRLITEVMEQAADMDALIAARRFAPSFRECIYRKASRSHRFLQLVDVFPHLAFDIGVPGLEGCTISPEWRERAREASILVEKGAKLTVVAQCMGTPMGCRKVKPGAVHLLESLLPSQYPDLVRFLPETTQDMRLWLNALRVVRQRNVPEMLEWTAKNALELGAKRCSALEDMMEDLIDWVRASTGNERHIDRKFTPDMSARTVLKLSDQWHKAVELSGGPQYALPAPWIPEAQIRGYDIIPLTETEQLYEEGRKMHHCVGSYVERVVDGECYIYSIRKDGRRVATMELLRRAGGIVLGQIRGPCNCPASADVKAAARKFIGKATVPSTVIRSRPGEPSP